MKRSVPKRHFAQHCNEKVSTVTIGKPGMQHTTQFKAIGADGSAKKLHIAFIGFMGAGKSTIARRIAEHYNLNLVDTDSIIEQEEGMAISEIFEKKGEGYFRRLETEVLARALESSVPSVIACGGGIVITPENRRLLEQHACVVYLTIQLEQALARFDDYASRPLLAQAGSADAIFALMEARLGLMETCGDIYVTTDRRTPEEVEAIVVARVKEAGYEFLREN